MALGAQHFWGKDGALLQSYALTSRRCTIRSGPLFIIVAASKTWPSLITRRTEAIALISFYPILIQDHEVVLAFRFLIVPRSCSGPSFFVLLIVAVRSNLLETIRCDHLTGLRHKTTRRVACRCSWQIPVPAAIVMPAS